MKSGKINGKKNLNAADCGKKKNLMYTFTRKSTEIILTQASFERQKITGRGGRRRAWPGPQRAAPATRVAAGAKPRGLPQPVRTAVACLAQ